jgi:ABC-2 type transport system ATP-binding protein
MPIVHADNLVKTFQRTVRAEGRFSALRTLVTREKHVTTAVDGVSLAIDEGEIVGYLGPNGAGKSTTIKMLTGILVPTSGTATVAGIVPWDDRLANARNIGVVFGQRSQLWWDLPLDESLRLIGRMYDVEPNRFRRQRDMLVELLDMESFLETPVRQLSLGQRMRGDLAAAVLYEPPVLFLDEPTVGLDVVAKERMRGFIEEINRTHRTTVMLTTHDLDDVERLCKRILIIDEGRVLFDGVTQNLKRRYAPYRLLEITVDAEGRDALGDIVREVPDGVSVRDHRELTATLEVDPAIVPVAKVIAELSARAPVSDLSVREQEMDSIIREIYEAREVRA